MDGIISCCYYFQCLKYLMLLNAYDAHRSRFTPFSNSLLCLAFRFSFPRAICLGLGCCCCCVCDGATQEYRSGRSGPCSADGGSVANVRLMAAMCLVENGVWIVNVRIFATFI